MTQPNQPHNFFLRNSSASRRFCFNQQGFSMIEVLVAILVVSVGLIGLALMQNMSLKYAQSSQYRTQAVALSSNLLEQIRTNRAEANKYTGTFAASSTGCAQSGTNISSTAFIGEWRCQMQKQLGSGAQAVVTRTGDRIQIQITWTDSWWETDTSKTKYTHTASSEI